MSTPIHELSQPIGFHPHDSSRSSEEHTAVPSFEREDSIEHDAHPPNLDISHFADRSAPMPSPSQARIQESQLEDDLELIRAERLASRTETLAHSASVAKSRTRRSAEPADDFDVNAHAVHEKSVYRPPEHPANKAAQVFKRIHESSFLVRYVTYITPVVLILLIPLLLGALLFKQATVGGVYLMWFSVWLEIVWLTLWAGRVGSWMRDTAHADHGRLLRK